MLAAEIAGAHEVWRIGGAQAVAALAYGTQSIRPVDKITGPGNAYVAAAKRRVFGQVGIDLIAGPSEILVVADAQNDPAWIAADLLSQAEHDASSQSVLIADDAAFADAVTRAVDSELTTMARADIAGASWRDNGAIILVRDLAACAPIVDRIAAEHVELAMEAAPAEALAERIHHAGAIFLGRYHARGDRRLCRRHQPCAADLARGALLGRAGRRRFPQAHLAGGLHARCARSPWSRGAGACRSRGPRRARPVGFHPAEPPLLSSAMSKARRIADIVLDEESVARRSPEVEHERAVALFDLLEENDFALVGSAPGPYRLRLGISEQRLVFDVRDSHDRKLRDIVLSLTPFRKVVKDYFLVCESYYAAIKKLGPSQIEALDMGRRGLHNEGSELLARAARRQDRGRSRHGPPAVHPDLRPPHHIVSGRRR